MISLTTLRTMRKRGVQPDLILDVIEAELAAEDIRVQVRRANDAERQRNWRASHYESQAVTVTNCDVKPSISSSNSSSISTTSTQKEGSKKERARKTQLPADWMPKTAHYAKAKRLGQSPSFVDQKADDLRDWARSKAIMRADWDATFNGFLKPRGNSNGSHRETLDERAIRLIDEAKQLEFAAGIRRADDAFGSPASGPIIDSELSERRG